jgi:cytochrome d ubiquinol oxidase subunit I
MDVLFLSRVQFALNICFHYLYPPMSIGLGLFLVVAEGLYLKTKKEKYKEITNFWIKIFALTFAIGVATGLVQAFAFGTNWSKYSRFVGDVFGSALAAEGVFAFFLEAGFLGVLLFGWDRVGPKLHYFATICVALGAHFSAVWIIVANSWMQTPTGFKIEDTPSGPRAVITNFWEMIFNPSSMDRLLHTLNGCWLTGAFMVISVGAYYMLKKRHMELARSMMHIGIVSAFFFCVLQLFSGDRSALIVAKYQPAKLAAFEGNFKTEEHTPLHLFGWVDVEKQRVHSIRIPGALSFLAHDDFTTPVMGLDQIPRDEWPNVQLSFQTYHLMVLVWGILFSISLLGLWSWWKNTLEKKRWLLWTMVFSVVLPHIAQQSGWIAAEVGRQPWIVWKILRTAHGVSASINKEQVIGSITMFVAIYILLFALFLFLLDRKIKHGPEDGSFQDKIYSDPLKRIP